MSQQLTNLLYLGTIVCFILALRFLSSPRRARLGNLLGALGMALAIGVALAQDEAGSYGWVAAGIAVGAIVGVVGARTVKMTAMPQMVALFNGVGGGAVALIALGEFHERTAEGVGLSHTALIAIPLSSLIGSISFAGSMVAFAKLQELIGGRPFVYPGQKVVNMAVLGAAAVMTILVALEVDGQALVIGVILAALAFGVFFVLPIGGPTCRS